MIQFTYLHPHGPHLVGFIPQFLNEDDPRPAKEQFNESYMHGGGWRPMEGFKMSPTNNLLYPGDPPIQPVAMLGFRDELIIVYHHAWVAIVQPDKSFEVARMD